MSNRKSYNNISTTERIITIAGALALLYLLRNRKSIVEKAAATALLVRGVSGYCPMYDITEKVHHKRMNVNIRTSITVHKPIEVVYEFWRDLKNLPLFMNHLDSVLQVEDGVYEWTASLPIGLGKIKWRADIVNEKPYHALGWKSVENSAVDNAGKVEFHALSENETRIDVVISYKAPLGQIGEGLAHLFAPSFKKMLISDLQDFANHIDSSRMTQ